MFKKIKDIFSNNHRDEVKSVRRIIFDTDCKVRICGFFKVNHQLLANQEDKEKLQDIVRQELFREKDFGYLVSRTRQAKVGVISIGNECNGKCTVHFELTTHFYNSYIARDLLSAREKAKEYLENETEVLYYADNIEKLGFNVEVEITEIGSREAVFFEGELGYEDIK